MKELNDQDIDENFVGVFPANHMNRFIDYKTMISENTINSDEDGNHWWSITDKDFFKYKTTKKWLNKYSWELSI